MEINRSGDVVLPLTRRTPAENFETEPLTDDCHDEIVKKLFTRGLPRELKTLRGRLARWVRARQVGAIS